MESRARRSGFPYDIVPAATHIYATRCDISLKIKGWDIPGLYSNKIKYITMTLAYTRTAVHHDSMTYFELPASRPFMLALQKALIPWSYGRNPPNLAYMSTSSGRQRCRQDSSNIMSAHVNVGFPKPVHSSASSSQQMPTENSIQESYGRGKYTPWHGD